MSVLRAHWWTGLLVLLALWAGSALQKRLPDPADIRARPFEHLVSRNASATLRTGMVNVVGLNASSTLHSAQGTAVSQHGVFLVLDVEFTASRAPATLANLTVVSADGRTFGGQPPVGSVSCGPGQPGIPVQCQVVFEMDKAALTGAELRVPADWAGGADDVAVIDLRVDDALAKDLAGRNAPLEVRMESRVEAR